VIVGSDCRHEALYRRVCAAAARSLISRVSLTAVIRDAAASRLRPIEILLAFAGAASIAFSDQLLSKPHR
jgi:hypothetical protein